MAYKQVMTAAGIHSWNNVRIINQLATGLKVYNLSKDEKKSINEKLTKINSEIVLSNNDELRN
jgi:hypothetical protein